MNLVITLIQLMSIASHLVLRLGQTSLYMIDGKKLFICVAIYLTRRYELGTVCLRLRQETGVAMYLARKYELGTMPLRLRLETGVAMYLARKYELGTVSLRLRLETGVAMYLARKYELHWRQCPYVSDWRRDSYFTWSSTEPRELSFAVCRTKTVPSFLGVSGVLSEVGMNACYVGLFVRVDVLQNFVFYAVRISPAAC